ncbi:MAG TPA: 4a-hydroxytetrahydrobiopterin dehydratase [Acidimicrobiales bacterium]|jgi:4a-hydroxytetrahydrobiopterin dehydratase|nr:4a-hydroxytetrahydrobiopterin dehydratase [Acidimicrobiales bacterium]
MSEPVLSDNQLAEALSAPDAPEWELVGGRLLKTVACAGFVGSLAYVNEVGARAEAADHHPDIDIRYNRVTLSLLTHDSGGITQKDLDLAKQIDLVTAGLN